MGLANDPYENYKPWMQGDGGQTPQFTEEEVRTGTGRAEGIFPKPAQPKPAPAQPFSTILTCPACATTVDSHETGWQSFECNNCETQFKVLVDPDKIKEHSLF